MKRMFKVAIGALAFVGAGAIGYAVGKCKNGCKCSRETELDYPDWDDYPADLEREGEALNGKVSEMTAGVGSLLDAVDELVEALEKAEKNGAVKKGFPIYDRISKVRKASDNLRDALNSKEAAEDTAGDGAEEYTDPFGSDKTEAE